ncbi:cell adhesion molecule CEACAM7-like isoform X3 [Dasypus novemcinctus]|uniref:cell adhesion molecule CEACAM7-like isoform X3 n=1 Tax=Dasypus novemcinctus TaxID=9361 RepID=UPI000C82E65D|nr:carcinoembryonic antigen-related cell adhesion molecule 7-like isoform X3 [Dasypus novemcinctus]
MEPPSGPPRRKCTPWQGPLLTVSLLIFWSRPVTAQLTIESKPVDAAEGSDVLLLVHNQPENPQAYHWFKGEREDSNQKILSLITNTQQITQGPAHSGRETIYPNGSLLIQKVTQNDSGIFHLRITDANFDGHSTSGQIRVYPVLPTPFIRSNTSDLVEGQGSVALTCEPETQNTTYQWSMNNQSLPDSSRLQLSLDNRILTIHNVTRKDTGPYECWTRNPVSVRRSDPFTLNVFSDSAQGSSPGLSAGAIAGIVIGALAGVVLITAVVYFLYRRKSGGASVQSDLTEHKSSTTNHSQGHSDISSNTTDEVAYSSVNFNAQQLKKPTSVSASPTDTETVYSEVKK